MEAINFSLGSGIDEDKDDIKIKCKNKIIIQTQQRALTPIKQYKYLSKSCHRFGTQVTLQINDLF